MIRNSASIGISILLFLIPLNTLAIAPSLNNASFDFNSRILTLTFDQALQDANVDTGSCFIGIAPDYQDNKYDIKFDTSAVVINNNTVQLNLDYLGINGYYTIYYSAYYTWGQEFSTARIIETNLSFNPIKVALHENAVFNLSGEGNLEMNIQNGILLQTTGNLVNGAIPLSAQFEEHSGTLRIAFDQLVQWDGINEDRADIWIDSLGITHIDPGNGVLNTGEDRNGNGVLDREKNVFLEGLTFTDNLGDSLALSNAYTYNGGVLTLFDNDTLFIQFTNSDRIAVMEMNTSDLNLIINRWTFTNQSYQGNPPVTLPLNYLPDTNPLNADSANYHLGYNELKVYFSSPIASSQTINPSKLNFLYPGGGIFSLNGSFSTVNTIGNYVKFTVLIPDQEIIEDLYYQYGGDNVHLEVEPYFALSNTNGFNYGGVVDISFTPESGTNRAPAPDSTKYEAFSDILKIYFDVNISQTTNNITASKISLTDGDDSVQVEQTAILPSGNNKYLYLLLTPECASAIEMGLDLNGMYLLMEPFAVLQSPKYNGNHAVTMDDSLQVQLIPDNQGPIPKIIRYEALTNDLVVNFNKTINPNTGSNSGITFSGVALTAQSKSLEDALTLRLHLIPADSTSLSALPAGEKINPSINIAENVFYSTTGAGNDVMSNLTFGTNMTLYGGNFNLIAGWGKIFTLKSYEAFPTPDYELPAYWRKSGNHCDIYVAEDQLQAYSLNNSHIPITQAEIDTVFNLVENSTPNYPTTGAYLKVQELVAMDHYVLVPEKCEILMADILDEFGLGRNNTLNTYYWGCRYESPSANNEETILLDSYPQLFFTGDSAWWWNSNIPTPAWYIVPSTCQTVNNAVINLLARWMCHYVDSDEEAWIVEGLSSICEQVITGNTSFYGDNTLNRTPNNSLTFIASNSTLLNTRYDLENSYLFCEYLYEKYGGEEIIKFIGSAEENGMVGVDSALTRCRWNFPLPEPFQSRTLKGIFLDYGTACYLDTSNGIDDRRFVFDNVNLYSTYINNWNCAFFSWNSSSYNVPPYQGILQPWSYSSFATWFDTWQTNPLLNPQGNLFYDGLDGLNIGINALRIRNSYLSSVGNQFLAEEISLDNINFGNTPLSIPGWTFGPDADDYKTHIEVVALAGTQPANNYTLAFNNSNGIFFPPSVVVNPYDATSLRLDFDLPWDEMGFGEESTGLSGEQLVKYIQSNKKQWFAQLLSDSLDNEGGLLGFTIYRSTLPDTGFALVQTGVDSLYYVDTGLLTGRTYYYRISADYSNPTGSSAMVTDNAQTTSPLWHSRLATAVSNFGNYGDPDMTNPSMEWPIGSGKYYLWEGRFWVGAEVAGAKLVSHADYGNYEWEPSDRSIKTYDVLGYDNFIHSTGYDDLEPAGGHTPIGLQVYQITREWTLAENECLADALLIDIEVENISGSDLHSVYLAWVFDCDIAAGPGGDPDQANIDDWVAFDRDRNMSYMFDGDYPLSPEDDTGEFGTILGYLGLRLLNSPDGLGAAHHAWWNWNSDPGSDEEKYSFMDGTNPMFNGYQYMQDPWLIGAPVFDYRFLLSIGPFDLPEGETLPATVVALIGDGLLDLQAKSDSIYTLLGGNVSQVENTYESSLPQYFHLYPNYPNPFNSVTTLRFDVPKTCEVRIEVFNLLGQRVAKLTDREYQSGSYSLDWETNGGSSGIYFVNMTTGEYQKTLKILLMK